MASEASGGLDLVAGVAHLTVFVASAPDFTDRPGVAHGASELVYEVLGEAGVHTRSAVTVAALPSGGPVELDGVLVLDAAPRPS